MARGSVIVCLLAVLGFASAQGLYTSKSPVLDVNAKNYDSLIAQSNHTSVAEFGKPIETLC